MKPTHTILIVDDEPTVRDTLEALLYQEGYNLVFAADGPEALTTLEKIEADVILLDVMMPGMSGLEVCRTLKGKPAWQHIPIILVSALDSKQDMVAGLEAGADDFLSKPVNGLELRARVRSMLRIKTQFDELQTTMKLREDLAGMLVHDMRNPLSSILGFSDFLLMANLVAPEGLSGLETIRDEARRLRDFMNDMLLLAKMEHDTPILNCIAVNVNQLAQQTYHRNKILADLKNIKLALELPETPEELSLDATLFQRVLDNLISNALKFSPEKSTVTIRLEYPKINASSPNPAPHLRLQVIDEGPGIAPQDRDRIFDKFEVAKMKGHKLSQVGLGLTFCKMVVEAHWGRVLVDNNTPKGTIFTVEI